MRVIGEWAGLCNWNLGTMFLRGPMNRALILVSFVMAACEVGEVPINNNPGGTDASVITQHDAGVSVDATPVALCAPRLTPANVAHVHRAGQTTHQGENCLAAGCHLANNVGQNAPGFQFGGTLYGIDGATPNAGATVQFTSMGGVTKTTTTDTAGNFYLAAGQLPQAFPAKTAVTVCTTGTTGPAPTPMTTPLANTDGACARAGCHTPGAGQGAIKLDPTI